MSLDLYMIIKSCEHCGHIETTESLNMTYNVAPMWMEIFPDDRQMIDIDGMCGDTAALKLKSAFYALREFPELFIKLNPQNGWGCYDDFMNYIEKLFDLSEKYPDGIWKSDR